MHVRGIVDEHVAPAAPAALVASIRLLFRQHLSNAFERIAQTPKASVALLECHLLTGRTHQIRVHLAARGWPIVGDPVYGEPRWSRIADAKLSDALRAQFTSLKPKMKPNGVLSFQSD